jgi:hypothetical protein
MPNCAKCGTYFPYRVKIDGIVRVLKNRKFCLQCSPFGQHNTKDLNKTLEEKDHKAEQRKRKQVYYVTQRRNENMKRAIEYKGGKCVLCGYDRCHSALEFHHLDPDEKEFMIASIYTLSWNRIAKELDKCVLLCSNCHREVEAGITSLKDAC